MLRCTRRQCHPARTSANSVLPRTIQGVQCKKPSPTMLNQGTPPMPIIKGTLHTPTPQVVPKRVKTPVVDVVGPIHVHREGRTHAVPRGIGKTSHAPPFSRPTIPQRIKWPHGQEPCMIWCPHHHPITPHPSNPVPIAMRHARGGIRCSRNMGITPCKRKSQPIHQLTTHPVSD